jgi:hypothetical protein
MEWCQDVRVAADVKMLRDRAVALRYTCTACLVSFHLSLCFSVFGGAVFADVCTSTERSSNGTYSYIISEKQAASVKGVSPPKLSVIFMRFSKLHARHIMTSFSSLKSARESVRLEIMKLFAFSFLAVSFILVISLPVCFQIHYMFFPTSHILNVRYLRNILSGWLEVTFLPT